MSLDLYDSFSREQNTYFDVNSQAYDNDKTLLSLLVNEYYNKYGVCMEYYIVTYDTTYDRIWGEDNNRCYIRSFPVMCYYTMPREDKVWTKFGIEGTDELTLWVSKRHFTEASINHNDGVSYVRPQIGDIIKSEYNNYFYEITEVAEDLGQFLQSNQYIWELTVRQAKNEIISVSNELSESKLNTIMSLDDIFNIANTVDVKKEDIIYEKQSGEKSSQDPFGSW